MFRDGCGSGGRVGQTPNPKRLLMTSMVARCRGQVNICVWVNDLVANFKVFFASYFPLECFLNDGILLGSINPRG